MANTTTQSRHRNDDSRSPFGTQNAGPYAIIRMHFAKEEEEVYLPLLDARLAPADAEEMFHAMYESARASGLAHRPPEHH
jgi:hypothetical protein